MVQVQEQTAQRSTPSQARRNWLRVLNLRPEESGRTFLMFAFYTLSSVGILWLEVCAAALFLGEYGAESLPWIYIASAGIGTGLGFFYSWLQKHLPLRRVIVLTTVLMAAPLLLFRIGLNPALLVGYTVFLMRLWLEAIYVINEVNTSITANQLFTIREIKRTYPFISSGILAADVMSGFSLPLLRGLVGLPNMIMMACFMLLAGAACLFHLTNVYRDYFPETTRKRSIEDKPQDFRARQLQGPLKSYVRWVIAFFVMVQVLALLLDFQYLSQLEANVSVDKIADFLALFSAILGIFELIIQWFVSGRMIERLGIFWLAGLPPVLIAGLSALSLTGVISLFVGTIVLKFVDELLRYTLVASTGPILFQPLPDAERSRIQADVRGIFEPLATGLTGVGMIGTLWLFRHLSTNHLEAVQRLQGLVFLVYTALFALTWLTSVLRLRSKYLEVLVLSAERGQLSLANVDFQGILQEIEEALTRPGTDTEKKETYAEFLIQNAPKRAGKTLAPILSDLPPALQRQTLEVMLCFPQAGYREQVKHLIEQPLAPEVLAAALRYMWVTEPNSEVNRLRRYLKPEVDPVVRGTAASLLLQQGNAQQKAEATDILRRMLTHQQEMERVMGCRALEGATYLQSLRLYIKPLLQDESLRVRCAVLEAIGATRLEEYYPSLLRGLQYKSTREAARSALMRLEDDAIPLLLRLAKNVRKPEEIRTQAWNTIGQLGTPQALHTLVSHLSTAWGANRRILLQVLLKLPQGKGIDPIDSIGRIQVEQLIKQELQFLAHLYAAIQDLNLDLTVEEARLLYRALRQEETDAIERIFLLLRFLYDTNQIQAAAFNLQSGSRDSVARGLEILDSMLQLSTKSVLLLVLDQVADSEKLRSLAELSHYQPMQPHQRLRHLLELRHFLSDWVIACCFHLARRLRWSLSIEQVVSSLRSPIGYVREAALAYLMAISPKAIQKLLPMLQADPDRLVSAQVQQMMSELGLNSTEV